MYLFLDTSDEYLNIGLFDDKAIIEYHHELAHRAQSEKILPTLDEMLKGHQLSVDDLTKVIITRGPGSYTGVRISMCVAKVLCSLKHIDLYTVSTLQAMCGQKKACAFIDARSQRAFVGFYEGGNAIKPDSVMSLPNLKAILESEQYTIIGNPEIINGADNNINLLDNVISLKEYWQHEENIHTLVPSYLKDQEDYGK